MTPPLATGIVAEILADLRAQLPHDSQGRPICPRCSHVVPEQDPICWACSEAAQREADLADARRAIIDGTRALLHSLPAWPWADVRNAEWRRRAHPRCVGVAERWTPLRGPVTVLGPSEAGKSSALRALIVRLRLDAHRLGDVAHPVIGARWVSGVDYAIARRELRRGSPDLLLGEMQHAPILALDEIGQEDAPPSWLLEVLDERYRHRRPTLTTSGLTRTQLEARYGAGIVRRLEQPGGQIVDLYEGTGG